MNSSLQAIYEVLKPGGRLFVDLHRISMDEDNTELVRKELVCSILSSVGFGVFETVAWRGTTDYHPFLAHKPTTGMECTAEKKVDQL